MTTLTVKEPVITLTSGPAAAYPRVLQAMSKPVQYDYDPYFQEFYENVSRKTAKALRVNEPALLMHAEPSVGLEAAAACLIAKDDVVLNLASGVYGKGFGYWALRHCKELVEIEVAYNEAIDPQAVDDMMRDRPEIKVVSLVHHDTPSGTLNPVNEIGRIVRDHEGLLLVDAVSSFGGMDVHPDECRADVFITGPGKCLGGPPGVTIMAINDRAWAHIEANKDCPTASILSLLDWKNAWNKNEAFPFTPSVSEVNGLDAVIDNYLEEGPEAVWARHDLTARTCRAGLHAMGFDLWAAREEIAAPTTTAVKVPDGFEDEKIRSATRDLYGVVLSAGRNETQGKLIRIGHMGPTAEPIYAVVALTALGGALRSLGHNADVGAGVEAAMDVIATAHA